MNLKKYALSWAVCLFVGTLAAFAQQSSQAISILDRAASAYNRSAGVSITFDGTQQGTLLLKGDCFYLSCNGIESWFDGHTQWSYAADEVTISNPSPEELQGINPYALINSYKTAFRCEYKGMTTEGKEKVYEIVLTPRTKTDINSVTLKISTQYIPKSIAVSADSGQQTFRIVSYQSDKNYGISTFRFDRKKYPHAEIIDMR